jgi:RNA polymerase sigma factor (sigma-70 family)
LPRRRGTEGATTPHTTFYMKAGEGQHRPRDPGLHLVPGTYGPPSERRIDEAFVARIVVNLMKGYSVDPDDVEDMAQTMRVAWARRAETDPEFLGNEAMVIGFLKIAVRRDFIDLVDKRRRRAESQAKLVMETEHRLTVADPLAQLEVAERRSAVNRALERMPEKRRRVCTLHFLEEKEMKEIAELMGIAYKTVDAHIQRGSKDLRRTLQEYAPRGPRKEQA